MKENLLNYVSSKSGYLYNSSELSFEKFDTLSWFCTGKEILIKEGYKDFLKLLRSVYLQETVLLKTTHKFMFFMTFGFIVGSDKLQ